MTKDSTLREGGKQKAKNSPSSLSQSREMKVRKNVIEWLDINLSRKGSTKTALADACGVRKQSVSNWFIDGRVKPANILAAAKFFGVEPPYDLMNNTTAEYSDPMNYPWRQEFRELVGKLMRDNGKVGESANKKARALNEVYDAMTALAGGSNSDMIRKSYISEMNDRIRVAHTSSIETGVESQIKQYGDFIYLVEKADEDYVQFFAFPTSPSDEKIVTDIIIEVSQAFDNGMPRQALVGEIGQFNERLLENLNVAIVATTQP
ncbi:TPA: helix-turn-helix domain-containing protein [Vibrio parahaemolyticus]